MLSANLRRSLEFLIAQPTDFATIEEAPELLSLSDMIALVEMGLVERGFSARHGGMIGYRITEAGQRALFPNAGGADPT
jgi:hypothetical protein